MDPQALPSRCLVAYSSADGFADGTIAILSRLGYEILSPEGFEKQLEREHLDRQPDLFIVDEWRLREVPAEPPAGEVPIIVLAASDSVPAGDPRIVAAIKPPVGMHDLYRLLQQVLEDRPRTTLRVRTRVAAVCRRSGREWNATVLSLSENGCLLQSPESVPLGTSLQLAFELGDAGTVHLQAETAYQLFPNLGLVFSSISPRIREAIAAFVTDALMEDDRRSNG